MIGVGSPTVFACLALTDVTRMMIAMLRAESAAMDIVAMKNILWLWAKCHALTIWDVRTCYWAIIAALTSWVRRNSAHLVPTGTRGVVPILRVQLCPSLKISVLRMPRRLTNKLHGWDKETLKR